MAFNQINLAMPEVAQIPLVHAQRNVIQDAPVAPPALEQHRNFSQFFSDERMDPSQRNYTRVMNRFDAAQPNAAPSPVLFSQVVDRGGKVAQAYLCCGSTANGAKIYCVHSPARFVASIEGDATEWDNLSFAFLGDLVAGAITTVNFPNDAFTAVTIRTHTAEYILNHLNDIDPVFPPVNENEADVAVVTTRKCMYLPPVYVPLFLSSKGYTLRQAWERLHPALMQRQELEVCRPLLDWLQAASMGTELAALEMGPPAVAITIQAPPSDESLLEHRQEILRRLLPGISAPSQGLESALSQVATALITQANDKRQERDQRAAAQAQPKLPSEKFQVSLPVLLEYLQVADERNLPTLWHKWANASKREEFHVLRDALSSFARSQEAFTPTSPVVTIKLVQELLNFNFVGDSIDDMQTGLHPFIIVDGNAEHRQNNLEVARLYGLLTAGDANCSLADLESLKEKEVRSVPLSFWELEKSLGMFGNLIAVVLGPAHPLVTAYKTMWTLMKSTVKDDLQAALDYKAYVKPTHILRSIQINFYTWFSYKRAGLAPATPDFALIIQQVLQQVYLLPHLPPALYQLAYPKKTPPIPMTIPGAASSSVSGSSSGSDASTMSTLTTGQSLLRTPVPAGQSLLQNPLPPAGGRGAFIANLHPNQAIKLLIQPNIKLKDLIGNTPPPKMDDGTEMCLSFLTRNGCWSNCKRARHHGAPLNPNEWTRLEQYLSNQQAAYTQRATAPGAPLPP